MSRRERTTALPRQRTREKQEIARSRFGRIGEREARLAILGGAVILLAAIMVAFAWRWYDSTFRRPETVIIQVGEEKVRLNYFADRLYEFALANPETNFTLIEAGLLAKLEEEAVTVLVARDRGVDLSDEAVTAFIAEKLGVPVGGTGSLFDQRYRSELRRLAMGDNHYRKLATAELADKRVRESISDALGETGEKITVRRIAVATQEEADSVISRINNGEDMGTIAQTLSLDTETVQTDGVAPAAPPSLLPDEIRAVLDGKPEGEVLGPVELNGQFWVFRIEERDEAAMLLVTEKTQLIENEFERVLAEKRASVQVRRNFNAEEARWARENADTGQAAPGVTP